MLKQTRSYLISAIALFFFLNSCQEDQKDSGFLTFYYPIEELKEGLIYEYQPAINDSLPVNYWYYLVQEVEGVPYLIGNNYNSQFEVQQFVRERVGSESVLLEDFILYEDAEEDKKTPLKVSVLSNEVFPSYKLDSLKSYKMSLKWDIPQEEGTSITLNRSRTFLNFGTFDFEGVSRKCSIFKLEEHIEHFVEDDGYLEPIYPGIEFYASGIGLVYYKKVLAEGVELEYKLAKRYSMSEFEKKFSRSLK